MHVRQGQFLGAGGIEGPVLRQEFDSHCRVRRSKRKSSFDLHSFLTSVELAAFRIAVTVSFLYALYRTLRHEIGW